MARISLIDLQFQTITLKLNLHYDKKNAILTKL
jgi:hypothetical protein